MKSQYLIFFGSDQYSAVVLNAIIHNSFPIIRAIVTDQPKPVGRDQKVEPNPVEKLAKAHNLKVSYYPDFDHSLITKGALGLCASFDHLIPTEIIEKFAGNLYNLHPSLLPQYRNVSPVQYALALGDQETGITLFRISPTIDDGAIIAQFREPILPTDTTPTLTSRLFKLGADLFLRSDLVGRPTRSDLEGAPLIFTKRLTRDSGYVEWPALHKLLLNQPIAASDTTNALLKLRLTKSPIIHNSLLIIHDLIRALNPWPTVWSLVPTRKGDLRISVPYQLPATNYQILIAGHPAPISLSDFTRYYL